MEIRRWMENVNNVCTSAAVFLVNAISSPDSDKARVQVGLAFISALFLLLSSLLALHRRCKFQGRYSGEPVIVFYSFLGNICSTVGATLSRDLHLQVFMAAFAAAVDAVHCSVLCVSLTRCFKTKAGWRKARMKRWRRGHLLALSALMVFGSGFLKFRFSHKKSLAPVGGRILLQAPIQDNTEILGYVLGLLSWAISCTSRLPALCKACKGLLWVETNILSVLASLLAGAFYSAAILLYDTQMESVIRVMPWLLSSIGIVVLELLILLFYWCKRKDSVQSMMFSSDTDSCSEIIVEDDVTMERKRKWPVPQLLQPKEEVEFRPLNRMRLMTRSDSFSSTDTSSDSSPVSSNLEWDIEGANAQWREPTPKEEGQEFSERESVIHPKQTS